MTYTFLYLTLFTWPCLEIFYETMWYQLICQRTSINECSGCPHTLATANCWLSIPILVSLCTCVRVFLKVKMKGTRSGLTRCDLMDYTVLGILQARILERVAFPFSRGLPTPGIKPRSPTLQADSLPAEPQWNWHLIGCTYPHGFYFSVLLRNNWHTLLCKFKEYSTVAWFIHILWNGYHSSLS